MHFRLCFALFAAVATTVKSGNAEDLSPEMTEPQNFNQELANFANQKLLLFNQRARVGIPVTAMPSFFSDHHYPIEVSPMDLILLPYLDSEFGADSSMVQLNATGLVLTCPNADPQYDIDYEWPKMELCPAMTEYFLQYLEGFRQSGIMVAVSKIALEQSKPLNIGKYECIPRLWAVRECSRTPTLDADQVIPTTIPSASTCLDSATEPLRTSFSPSLTTSVCATPKAKEESVTKTLKTTQSTTVNITSTRVTTVSFTTTRTSTSIEPTTATPTLTSISTSMEPTTVILTTTSISTRLEPTTVTLTTTSTSTLCERPEPTTEAEMLDAIDKLVGRLKKDFPNWRTDREASPVASEMPSSGS
ncbi:hypothetical protein BP5796_10850 [Coleophoma crateriformis]|uniref:Ig-like domain-containing protein n=1 Tax=Coleophoma crateriformis TaxID=565419 RepID=A0A3D8QLG1_9HELO|nr:hypothetical protein BP5796_10850 [Coleophoma crateriformis]